MKVKCLLRVAVMVLLCCALFGCKPDDNTESGSGKIYGTVNDYATSEPVNGANVQLRPSGKTALTGSDGRYEFIDVASGTYFIKVTKEGYSDLIDDYDIVVTGDQEIQRDVQIRKLPSSLHIYDNEQHEISELDFGADEGVTQRTIRILNDGHNILSFTIIKTANWISNISQTEGTIDPGKTCPIVVTIDRSLLADGNNTTKLIVTSPDDGGNEITVKARKGNSTEGIYELSSAGLMVQTEDLGAVDWYSAKLLCENSTIGGFNDWRLPTKEELAKLYVNKEAIGGFVEERYWSSSEGYSSNKYYVDFANGVAEQTSYTNQHYYVRAVRTMSSQNLTYEIPTANLMVQTQDLGCVSWSSAELMCSSSTVAGYNDWRLPTMTELMTLYNERNSIGGFQNGSYWSSDEAYNGRHSIISFYDGSTYTASNGGDYYVRAVRSLSGTTTTVPSVSTTAASNVSTNTATCSGNVTSDGGANVIQRGVCYGTSQNPTTSNQVVTAGSGTGSFTCNLTGLSANTTYYVRAYAINSEGTAYGEQISFNTTGGSTTPSVSTSTPTNVTNNSATCGGNVTSDGGANVIQRGVCYGTSQNPTTSNQVVTAGSGTGSFTCNLTGLSASTTYYVRAYAINSEGTVYGEQKSFTTTGGGSGGGQTFTYTFESGAEDWNIIDADGDGYNWGRYEGDGYNSSYFVSSASFINDVGALTPNNFLYTPERIAVTNGAKISFYVCAQDADWPAEHYGVAVATVAGTPVPSNFTTIWEETLSAKVKKEGRVRGTTEHGTWYLKTIDLSAYAGQSIWIAIRHFNSTDQYMLNVDNITIFTGN